MSNVVVSLGTHLGFLQGDGSGVIGDESAVAIEAVLPLYGGEECGSSGGSSYR